MDEVADKDQLARIEKYAQAHLERVHAVSNGATKTALLWLVALAIIWFQQLEPKLKQVRDAQTSRRAIAPASTLGLQRLGVDQKFQRDEDLAKQEELELPFSIKFKLPPELVPTFWLTLAFGLNVYLLVTRRRVLQLAARGVRLLQHEVKAEPPYVRSVVGAAVWWLTPLPTKKGKVVTAKEFRQALGWAGDRHRPGYIVLILCVLALLIVETRVFYIGFCAASFLVGLLHPAWWLVITAVNCGLFSASVLSSWRWFEAARVPDELDGEASNDPERRRTLKLLWKGGALSFITLSWIAVSTYGFARFARQGKSLVAQSFKTRTRRRKKHLVHSGTIADGLYLNPKTGTVHTATSKCRKCLNGVSMGSLRQVAASDVAWNGRPRQRLLASPLMSQSGLDTTLRDNFQGRMNANRAAPFRTVPATPHPHAAHRIFMVEQAALDLLAKNSNVDARRLLLDAVIATQLFGLRQSMRLFDLLAGLTVRFDDKGQLDTLIQILKIEIQRIASLERDEVPQKGKALTLLYRLSNNEPWIDEQRAQRHHEPERQKHEFPNTSKTSSHKHLDLGTYRDHNEYLKLAIEQRLQKWQDGDNRWHQLWSNRQKPVKWTDKFIA